MAFNENGLKLERYNEIVNTIQEEQKANIVKKFSYQNNNKIHQLNSVYARSADQISQLVEAAFDSMYISSAEGYHLEELALLRGVYRIDSEPSFTNNQYAILSTGATIPAGSQFYSSTLGIEAVNNLPVSASTAACSEATILTSSLVEGVTYGFSINGIAYLHVAQPGEDLEDVHGELKTLLDGDTDKEFTYTEQVAGVGRSFVFISDSNNAMSVVTLTTKMSIQNLKVHFRVDLKTSGAISVGVGLMDTLLSPVVGLISTSNDAAFTIGREVETDAELRSRVTIGAVGDGTGTPDTIRSSLLTNVSGVSYVEVIENLEDFPVDSNGVPFMAFETLVIGGDNDEVAQELWRVRGAAARTHGGITRDVVDGGGLTKFVKFSRPTSVAINVNVSYTLYDEEVFPNDGETAIKQAIADYINSLPIGKDIIVGRIFKSIYATVDGVGVSTISVEDAGDPGLVTTTLPIGPTYYATTTVGDITLTDITP